MDLLKDVALGFLYFFLGAVAWELFGFGLIFVGAVVVVVMWLFTRAAREDENDGRKP
jgi:hypothetical protein